MTTGTPRGAAKETSEPFRGTVDEWLTGFAPEGEIGRLLGRPKPEQQERGYGHTLREIAQQPVTWLETASAVAADRARLDSVLDEAGVHSRAGSVLLTGSGSSLYAGECIALPLQHALGVPVQAVSVFARPCWVPPQGVRIDAAAHETRTLRGALDCAPVLRFP